MSIHAWTYAAHYHEHGAHVRLSFGCIGGQQTLDPGHQAVDSTRVVLNQSTDYINLQVILLRHGQTRSARAELHARQRVRSTVRRHGGSLQAVAVLVDRSNGKYKPDVPLHSLLQMVVETFEPDNLPEDLRGTEAVKPGSN